MTCIGNIHRLGCTNDAAFDYMARLADDIVQAYSRDMRVCRRITIRLNRSDCLEMVACVLSVESIRLRPTFCQTMVCPIKLSNPVRTRSFRIAELVRTAAYSYVHIWPVCGCTWSRKRHLCALLYRNNSSNHGNNAAVFPCLRFTWYGTSCSRDAFSIHDSFRRPKTVVDV